MNLVNTLESIKWGFVARGVLFAVVALFVLTPLALYIGLAPVVAQPFYNKILFQGTNFPVKNWKDQKLNGVEPKEATFRAKSGNLLHGLMFDVPGASKTLLFSHGNGHNCTHRSWVLERLVESGVSVFVYDYSGYGKSTGEPSLENLCDDGEAALQYLTTVEKIPLKKIVLFGESLGTLVAGRLASQNQCAGVIMLCPLLSLRRVGGDRFDFLNYYPDFAFSRASRELDNGKALKNCEIPKLFVAGTADKLTRIEQADELVRSAAGPKQYVRIVGASHEDSKMSSDENFKKALSQFLASEKIVEL